MQHELRDLKSQIQEKSAYSVKLQREVGFVSCLLLVILSSTNCLDSKNCKYPYR
jgi:hypothetical protein